MTDSTCPYRGQWFSVLFQEGLFDVGQVNFAARHDDANQSGIIRTKALVE